MGYLISQYKFDFDNVNNQTNQAPDNSYTWEEKSQSWKNNGKTDYEIDVSDAETVTCQADSNSDTNGTNASTDFDINLVSSGRKDNSNFVYDDGANGIWWEMNIGDTTIQTLPVTLGVGSFKVRGDENSTNAGYVEVYITVRKYQ